MGTWSGLGKSTTRGAVAAAALASCVAALAMPAAASAGTTPSSVGVDCVPASVRVGQDTICNAVVSGAAGTPTETIQINVTSPGGAPATGSCTLAGGQCGFGLRMAKIGSGTYQVKVTYQGDATYAGSEGIFLLTVTKRSTQTTVACLPVSLVNGTATSCTATVTDTDPAGIKSDPNGRVEFSTDRTGTFGPGDGTFVAPASCVLVPDPSPPEYTSTCSVLYTPTDAAGANVITAEYSDSDTGVHADSSDSTNLTVSKRTTSTSLSCIPSTPAVDQGTLCTATVTDNDVGTPSGPTTTVTFSGGGAGAFAPANTCTLAGPGSSRSCAVTFTPSTVGGPETITSDYGGDSIHLTSSDTDDFTSVKRTTSTRLDCVPSAPVVAQEVQCTATVTDADAGTPSGPTTTVSFSGGGAGAFAPASNCTLTGSGSSRSCEVTFTPSAAGGPHGITADYGGDATHEPSDDSVDLTVSKRSTETQIACVPAAVAVGQPTTCGVTVTDSSPGPGGSLGGDTVGFSHSGDGALDAPTCVLSPAGTCRVTYTPSAVGSATHTVTASYTGTAAREPSGEAAPVSVGVRTSATTVICNPPRRQIGLEATCTATVTDSDSGNGSTPTGSVDLGPAGSCALSAGSCSVNYTPVASDLGTLTLTAAYGGDAAHAPSSGTTTLEVKPQKEPNTRITKRALKRRPQITTFQFKSSIEGSTFFCSLDDAKAKPCEPGVSYPSLERGRHAFSVYAVSLLGVVDRTPAESRFLVRVPLWRR